MQPRTAAAMSSGRASGGCIGPQPCEDDSIRCEQAPSDFRGLDDPIYSYAHSSPILALFAERSTARLSKRRS